MLINMPWRELQSVKTLKRAAYWASADDIELSLTMLQLSVRPGYLFMGMI